MGKTQPKRKPAAGKPLSPDSLIREFGPRAELTRRAVRTLSNAVLAPEHPTVSAALQQWEELFGNSCGWDFRQAAEQIGRLAARHGIQATGTRARAVLFALHTYYAILVNLLVGRVMDSGPGSPAEAERLLSFDGNPFSWYAAAESKPIERLVGLLAARLAEYDPGTPAQTAAGGRDLLGGLYQELFPRPLRHALGEYYTPDWLADHVLDVAGYSGDPQQRLLDPACGSGTFLLRAIKRVRSRHESGGRQSQLSVEDLCRGILANVVGFDLNPLAVITARANYLVTLRDLLRHGDQLQIPIYLCDSILHGPESTGHPIERFDYVVGNPPWIAWDNLPAEYRRATKPLWERYGLFSLSAVEGRHGGGKKDLSMLMMYTGADRYLKHRGRLAMVITQTLFQTKGAGDGFRRFRLGPNGDPLKVLRVDDMTALRPFRHAANFTSTILVEKGAPTQYPVPYVKWSAVAGRFKQRTYQAQPIEPGRPGSPWFLRPTGLAAEPARLIGPSDYRGYLGANSGGANGVYWVEVLQKTGGGVLVRNIAARSKRSVEVVEQVVEPDLLYPLLRWADVARFRAAPSAHILLTQDPAARTGIDEALIRREYPKTYAYLKRFERVLLGRSAYKRYQPGKAFYSMYNVGTYTVAPIKVVWRRMDRRLRACVVEEVLDPLLGPRPVIPQETCVLVPCGSATEAHYVCAVLSSSIVNFLVVSHSVGGGKGFGTPSMLDYVNLRRFDPHSPLHQQLAACSRQAHAAASTGEGYAEIEHRIDRLAGQLWGLDHVELGAITAASRDDS